MSIRSHVFIDKISVTIPVPHSNKYWDIAAENLNHVIHRGFNLTPVVSERLYTNYQQAWQMVVTGNDGELTNCLIQIWPKFTSSAFLRLEWNPTRAPNAIGEIKALMARCIPDFDECWHAARLSRVDVTADVYRISIEQLFAFAQSSRNRYVPFRKDPQDKARLTGYQLGAGTSNRRLSVYDKKLESTGGKPTLTYREGIGWCRRNPTCRTRFEFRVKDLGPTANLHLFENPLLRYSIVSAKLAAEYSQKNEWQRFISSCIRNGAQEALARIADRKRRQRYREILNTECTSDWFNRDIFWDEARAAIASILSDESIRRDQQTTPPESRVTPLAPEISAQWQSPMVPPRSPRHPRETCA